MRHAGTPGRIVAAIDLPALPAELRARMEETVEKLLAAADLVIAELDRREPVADLEPSLSGHCYSAANGAPYIDLPHDQDLELDTSDLEPSLSAPEGVQHYEADGQPGVIGCDLEQEHDGREPDVDDEPSLSAPEPLPNWTRFGLADPLDQGSWLRGGSNDLEDEHDGCEPDVDDELTLGRTENIDQSRFDPGQDDTEPSLCGIHASALPQAPGYVGNIIDGEEQCEDEGGACEDEGADIGDREPDQHHMCNWQDEGDQTVLRQLPVFVKRRASS